MLRPDCDAEKRCSPSQEDWLDYQLYLDQAAFDDANKELQELGHENQNTA